MRFDMIFAHVSCSDLSVSEAWYGKLFGQPPAGRPMPGSSEWHFNGGSKFQLHKAPELAGHSTLRIGVITLEDERRRLAEAGLKPGLIQDVQNLQLIELHDPDHNLVMLTSARPLGPKDADPQYGDGTEA